MAARRTTHADHQHRLKRRHRKGHAAVENAADGKADRASHRLYPQQARAAEMSGTDHDREPCAGGCTGNCHRSGAKAAPCAPEVSAPRPAVLAPTLDAVTTIAD